MTKVQSLTELQNVGTYGTADTSVTWDAPPANTIGYGVWDQGGSNQEIVKWTGLSGNITSGMLRGLSLTALTDTEVLANKKNHDDAEVLTLSAPHYIFNEKTSRDDNETVSGDWVFTTSPQASSAATVNEQLIRYGETVRSTGDQTVAGVKTFSSIPATTAGNPTTDNELARKKYVDELAAGQGDASIVFGEDVTVGDAVSIEPISSVEGGTFVDFGRDAVSQGVKQSQSFVAGETNSTLDLKIYLRKQGSPSDNFFVTIETDSSGDPSGTTVTNGTSDDIAGSSLTGTSAEVSITFASTPVLTQGEVYHIVLQRDGANSDTDYYQVEISSVNALRSGQAMKYTTNWTTNVGSSDDWRFSLGGAGAVLVKGIANSYNSGRGQLNFHGIVAEDKTRGEKGRVVLNGVATGLSGLSPNTSYYLSTSTAGDLSTTQQSLLIGVSSSNATDLRVLGRRNIVSALTGGNEAGSLVALNSSEFIEPELLNAGTGANQIVQRGASGEYPSGNGNNITNTPLSFASGSGNTTSLLSTASPETLNITGVGFNPSLVIVYACFLQASGPLKSSYSNCMFTSSGMVAGASIQDANAGRFTTGFNAAVINDSGNGASYVANDFDSDGFSLVFTAVNTVTTSDRVYFNWIAFR